jgi:predicted nucleic acid-binding protein
MRPKPSAGVVAWVAKQPAADLYTTAITQAEIFYGIELLREGKRRDALLAAAEAMFAVDFAGRVFVFDGDAAREFSRLAARAEIAAITRLHRATLVTRNGADFFDCGIEVIDPWTAL